MSSTLKYHLVVLLATLLVAGSHLASANLSHGANPISLTLFRFLVAVMLLSPFILFSKKRRTNLLKTLPKATVISLFYVGYFVILFESLKTTIPLNTATLSTLLPLMTALLAYFIAKEPLPKKKLNYYLIGFLGTLWVIFKGDLQTLQSFSLNQGDYLFMLAVVSLGLYVVMMKKLYKNDDMWLLVFCILVSGVVWMSLALVVFQQPLEWHLIFRKADLINMLYLIIGATLVTVYLFQVGTVHLGASKVNNYNYILPAFTALLSLLFYQQDIPLIIIPGISLSIIATVLLQRE